MATLSMTAKNLTTDQSALLQFKAHITSDPYNVLAYNWSISNPICSWVGISCNARHERVRVLNLSFMDLGGTISPHLGNLSFLVNLDLSYNNFHGHLPNELGQLRRLRVFSVGNNRISGVIPGFIGLLSKLQILNLEYNNFTGTIPDVLFNVTTLEVLWAIDNNIQGSISPEIAKLTRLKIFYMAINFLSGSIPWSSIFNSSSLQWFSLTYNFLSGSLPDGLCNRLPKLEWLILSYNGLSGSLPDGLCNRLPKLGKLKALILDYNPLHGVIPLSIGNLSETLENFSASNCKINGSIPAEVGNLHSLIILDLSQNDLNGFIPTTMGNLRNLQGIQSLKVLRKLDLSKNLLFEGAIPSTFGALISLVSLDLPNNSLSGEIPKSLEALTYLKNFNVSINNSQGEIPSKGPFKNFSTQSFLLNHTLCGLPRQGVPCCIVDTIKRSKTLVMKYILPSVLLVLVTVIVTFLFIKCYYRRKHSPVDQVDSLPLATWRRTSYMEIQQATDDFSECNLLSIGSFGSVFKGTLSDGTIVAIKTFNLQEESVLGSFDSECEVLRNIHH
ncbi:putative receptor-like protein kinase At3g47110 [Mangifera indica]|uniref:putative receptor-like protein kinase At3g47110 n=1 Tax=Mangifera indica TaxID=29780 RepID=UPI001CFAA2C4|nr:putative receptor-like protein kinase At3g47110 [Mangifera indica]